MNLPAGATGPLRGPLRKRESHLWTREDDDYYVEPSWVSERLFAAEHFEGMVHDPACGSGNIVRSARAAGLNSYGADIKMRWDGTDYERDWLKDVTYFEVHNIVTNPPFKHAQAFVEKALWRAQRKVAVLLPANWIQGTRRARWLAMTPLYRLWFICPRPSMPPGHVIEAGLKPGNGTTDYAWFVWLSGYSGPWTGHWLHREG